MTVRPFVAAGEELWVFAYGSLMWRPDFPHLESHQAILHGYHRRFCIYSHRYRGTPEVPGLVLGLARGGSCHGMVFRVAAPEAEAVTRYLWDREMVTGVYLPTMKAVRFAGRRQPAACFIADPRHRQYCAERDPDSLARLIVQGHGQAGPNSQYLFNTLDHLRELGINDAGLEGLARRVRAALG
ncbi:MAG: gamma-glutamylcyclotransferase [Azospirillaceae bacterium]